MTEDDQDLLERMEALVANAWDDDEHETLIQARDRIEALIAENERLREALGWFLNDSRFVVQVGGNPNVVPQMIEAARAALGDTTND